jgi:hypothetical protein
MKMRKAFFFIPAIAITILFEACSPKITAPVVSNKDIAV